MQLPRTTQRVPFVSIAISRPCWSWARRLLTRRRSLPTSPATRRSKRCENGSNTSTARSTSWSRTPAATRPDPLEEISEEDWRAAVDANLTATFLTIKCFLTGMKERGRGNVITISSAAARRPHPGSRIAYAAAKAGIELLTKDAAAQAGPHGIRVNCIAPETIMTETNQQQIPAQLQESLRESHPIRRLGTPDDVAQTALFLASDNFAWISGIVIDVAGGAVLV
jgi:NAD(P)-dependent dehydrogenase (short-subunit alcohol dehydrogenase family)